MLRVMFVDDEPRLLEGLRDLLRGRRHEWDMVFAGGGQEALRELDAGQFDVVVTDMRMPGMDGATLLRHVQALQPDAVRIVLSGYTELESAMRAVPVTHQYLTKPTTAGELENVVERACRLRARITDERIRTQVGGLPSLPSSPQLYTELSAVLADERAGAREITAVLEQDLAMCARVLQLANSASFGGRWPITSIGGAVAYLGCNMVRSLALVAGVFGAWSQPMPAGFSPEALQKHSMQVSALAMRVLGPAAMGGHECFVAAMLHDVGKLVLAAEAPERTAEIAALARKQQRPVWRVEEEVLGLTHADVGAYLLGLWGLTYNIVEAVAHHHSPAPVQQTGLDVLTAVHVANCLAHEQAHAAGAPDGEYELPYEPYLISLGLAGQMEGWRETAREQWEGAGDMGALLGAAQSSRARG